MKVKKFEVKLTERAMSISEHEYVVDHETDKMFILTKESELDNLRIPKEYFEHFKMLPCNYLSKLVVGILWTTYLTLTKDTVIKMVSANFNNLLKNIEKY